jgi:hypothetical protein
MLMRWFAVRAVAEAIFRRELHEIPRRWTVLEEARTFGSAIADRSL